MSVQLEDLYGVTLQRNDGDLECIIKNNNDIKKLAIMQIRLTKLLLEDKLSIEGYSMIEKKYSSELKNSIELRELYLKRVQEESKVNAKELESVLEYKELVSVRKKLGDMGDEEYKLKTAVYNWDINNLNRRKSELDKSLEILQELPSHIHSETIEELNRLSYDNFKVIKESYLDDIMCEKLINTIKNIERIFS